MTRREKIWLSVAVLVIAVQLTITFAIHREETYHLPFATLSGADLKMIFGDLSQTGMILLAVAVMAGNAVVFRGLVRVFWTLMAIGMALWAGNASMWTYYEVIRHTDVPSVTVGDTFLFLHWVPMLAALAVRPERRYEPASRKLAWLDFLMLMAYWFYIYAFLVMPYEFVRKDLAIYNNNYDLVDRAGNWFLVAALGIAVVNSRDLWRKVYMILVVAAISYAVFSQMVNVAINSGTYYTGSYYDILWMVTMCWFIFAGLHGRWMLQAEVKDEMIEEIQRNEFAWSHPHQWHSLLGMLVTVSTPLIGLYFYFATDMEPAVRRFRITVTLASMVVLVLLVVVKQRLLQQNLERSLADVSLAYGNLQRAQSQLVQSEKLASMGRLLAGAAQEISSPVGAILKYSSEITAGHDAESKTHAMAEKIAEQARRTNTLLKDLLTFSQQTTTQRTVSEVPLLVKHAVNIAGLETGRAVKVEFTSEEALSPIFVDPGQILQVFVHLIRNAADAMRESPVRVLRITAMQEGGAVKIAFTDSGVGIKAPQLVFDPFYTTKAPGQGTGLGLSACYGILQMHDGSISCGNLPEGGAVFTVTLPGAPLPIHV